MDVLSDAVAVMRTGRAHASRTTEVGPWGFRFLPSDLSGFHVVLQGSGWLTPPGGEPVALGPGDLVFMPRGLGHTLASGPSAPLADVPPTALVELAGQASGTGRDGGAAASPQGASRLPPGGTAGSGTRVTVLLCGAYRLDRQQFHPLLDDLPPVLILAAGSDQPPSLRAGLDLLDAELTAHRPGSLATIPALLDVVLVELIRSCFGTGVEPAAGWEAALSDPVVGTALRIMHEEPRRAWTVEELASRAGLSRAAFAARFTALAGRPPLTYLRWWRMTVAGRRLRDSTAGVGEIARQVGYASESAFAKAFTRHHGTSPGRFRRL